MKKFLAVLAITLFASPAFATLSAEEIYLLNNKMGAVGRSLQFGTLLDNESDELDTAGTNVTTLQSQILPVTRVTDGAAVVKLMRSSYDVATDTGTIAAHALSEQIPAKAIITRAWFYTVTQFTDSGSGTVALHCVGANDLFAAADITGNAAGTLVEAIPDGTAAKMIFVNTACTITATVAGAAQTAGKLVLFVEYVIAE